MSEQSNLTTDIGSAASGPCRYTRTLTIPKFSEGKLSSAVHRKLRGGKQYPLHKSGSDRGYTCFRTLEDVPVQNNLSGIIGRVSDTEAREVYIDGPQFELKDGAKAATVDITLALLVEVPDGRLSRLGLQGDDSSRNVSLLCDLKDSEEHKDTIKFGNDGDGDDYLSWTLGSSGDGVYYVCQDLPKNSRSLKLVVDGTEHDLGQVRQVTLRRKVRAEESSKVSEGA